LKNSIVYSVVDFFRGNTSLNSSDTLFVSQALFVWLKLSSEKKLDEHELYIGSDDISERFKHYIHGMCSGYNYQMRGNFTTDDINFYLLVEQIDHSLQTGLISYFEVAEIIFEYYNQDSDLETQAPNELVELGSGLLSDNITSVYCPFTASYRFAEALSLQNQQVSLELSSEFDTAWTRMSAELKDAKYHQEWLPSNPVTNPAYLDAKGLKQFSHTIAMAPFGLKYSKDINDIFGRFPEKSLMGEVLQLRHMLAQSSEQVVTFVNSPFLSRTAAGEKIFKQSVIKQGWLQAVIALPAKLLNNTQIAINVLVFNKKNPVDKVLFIDASSDEFIKKGRKSVTLDNIEGILNLFNNPNLDSELSIEVPISDIEANEFNILPSRYVLSPEQKKLNKFLASHQTQTLAEIAELITPQAIKDELGGEIIFNEFGLTHTNGIGELVGEGKQVSTSSMVSRAKKQQLQSGDILIVNKGAVGKVVIVGDDVCNNAMPSQAFTIVRLSKHISNVTPKALFQYLLSPMGQLQLNSLSAGQLVTMIGSKDLKTIRILEFLPEQIEHAENTFMSIKTLYNKSLELKAQITELNNADWL